MYLHKTPQVVQDWFPNYTWRKQTDKKEIYLTFDDGPIPELTPWVLDQLSELEAKATFFVVGENVQKHQGIFERILQEEHSFGNHTFNHLNGRKYSVDAYLDNIELCKKVLPKDTSMFRPPYGLMTRKQSQAIRSSYEVVMWDVLSADFDIKLSPEKCLERSIKLTKPGSIIVFHDNVKATERLKYTLPRYLEHFSNLGFKFLAL